jgi:hypothetical protein
MVMLTLKQAGIPYPDMTELQQVLVRLEPGGPVHFYGGYLRDLVLLGNVPKSADIDVIMANDDFLRLKPLTPDRPDWRRDFVLHPPHLLFMMHQISDGAFGRNPKPLVLALKPEQQQAWDVRHPVGVTLSKDRLRVPTLLSTIDLAFCQIVSDGVEVWVTPGFVRDMRNRTMTLRRCPDAKEYERSLRRVARFQADRYADWRLVMPGRYSRFASR